MRSYGANSARLGNYKPVCVKAEEFACESRVENLSGITVPFLGSDLTLHLCRRLTSVTPGLLKLFAAVVNRFYCLRYEILVERKCGENAGRVSPTPFMKVL